VGGKLTGLEVLVYSVIITECAANCWAAQADNLDAPPTISPARKVNTVIGTKKPVGRKITNTTSLDHSRCWECSHLHTHSCPSPLKFLYRNRGNLKPGLMCKVSIIFKASTDFSQFLFSEHSAFWYSFLHWHSCLNLFTVELEHVNINIGIISFSFAWMLYMNSCSKVRHSHGILTQKIRWRVNYCIPQVWQQ
jgi:hypothetical protein